MQHVTRLILIALLAVAMTAGVRAVEDARQTAQAAEYKRSDMNFHPKGDVMRAHPSAVIIAEGSCTRKGDSYFFTPQKKAPREIYIEVLNDWIEPITPPDMPASLGVPPDAMQIREPQGDVQAALPSAPANFTPVKDGMTLPNGAVVKTGTNGTAAVLFGGVASARLMPNSAAAVQQTVTAQSRSVEVDLTTGGVFSKVGTQAGVKEDYEVHTPLGNAVAHGTDFVTIATPAHTDVWVAQGTVHLESPTSKATETATSDGTGALKVLRLPAMTDPRQALQADAETITTILNFIPMANQKVKALRDKKATGGTLTASEQAYLNRIKQVPCLIKLALVTPPASAPAPPVTSAPPPAPPALSTEKMVPVEITLRPDGKVDLAGQTISLDDLKTRLTAIAKESPAQPLVIKGRDKVTHDQFAKVRALYKALKLKVATPLPPPPGSTLMPPPVIVLAPSPVPAPRPASAPAPPPPPAPAIASPPTPPPATPTVSAPTAAPAPPSPSPASPAPIRAVVRMDGKVNVQGATYELPGFKAKLETLLKATPDQAILLKAGKTVPYEKFQEALNVCHSIPVKNLSVVPPEPTPGSAATEPTAANLPAPSLVMHPLPSTESISSNAPPEAPAAPPATNAAPPAGP